MFLKKGQISIFVIMGILMILTIIFLTLSTNNTNELEKNKNLNGKNTEKEQLKIFLDSCFESSYYKALQNIGFHGGYFIPEDTPSREHLKTDYLSQYHYTTYSINDKVTFPNTTKIEDELLRGQIYHFDKCISNQSSFELEYSINKSEGKVTLLQKNAIKINLNLSITDTNELTKTTYSTFNYKDEYSNLNTLYNLGKEIADEQSKHPNNICLSCLYRIEQKEGVIIYTQEIYNELTNSNIILYFIEKENSEYNDIAIFSIAHYIKGYEE